MKEILGQEYDYKVKSIEEATLKEKDHFTMEFE